ncbi:MAG: acetylxylan esterase [Bacteroidales bacterium]|nr:acetylxylan esterase [Bacteroidales bacterium]
MKRLFSFLVIIILSFSALMAQPKMKKVQLIMIPDHDNALYLKGEEVKFEIMAFDCGVVLNDIIVDYEICEDLMPSHKRGTVTLKGNRAVINAGTMSQPGYLRIKASTTFEGTDYTSISTVGFETEKLQPAVKMPNDFDSFWADNLEQLKKVGLKPEMELLPDRCTESVNVYHVSYGNIGGSRMYGVLTMPKAPGKYPAILRMPGAGVHAKSGNVKQAAKGAIILELGIHGVSVILDDEVYNDMGNGPLASYFSINLHDKNSYYFKRVYLGCVKGVDFLLSLPQCNGKVGILGGSQGGQLSIVTSALDERIAASAIYFPAFCDQEAYLSGRTGGYPHFFKMKAYCKDEYIETVRYYDAANFAKRLKAPVFFAYGYNDLTCGPTTSRATYNVITAPKELVISENSGHWLYPEHDEQMWNWLIDKLQ